MKHKYLRLKYLSVLIIILLIMTSCETSSSSNEIERLNNKLDILSMLVYDDQLYVGSTMGLYILDEEDDLVELDLETRIGFIYALYEVEQGVLIGGLNGLILLGNDGRETVLTKMLPDKRVYTINEDLEGNIYIGTFDGLLVMDESLKPIEHSIDLLSNMVNVIDFDNDGNKIISSYNVRSGGITIVEDRVSTFYDSSSEISTINTTSMVMLGNSFFIGGGMYETGGFDKFEYTTQGYQLIKSYTDKDGLAGPKVRSMLRLDHRLLVGSEYDGFSVLNFDDEFTNIDNYTIYTTKNGLSHNEIKCMIVYNDYIYFGTKAGLSKMELAQLN